MIVSKVRRLRFEKEEREGRRLTYETMRVETGLSEPTIARLLKPEPIERIDGKVISAVCRYFGCGVGDVLEYVSSDPHEASQGEQ